MLDELDLLFVQDNVKGMMNKVQFMYSPQFNVSHTINKGGRDEIKHNGRLGNTTRDIS